MRNHEPMWTKENIEVYQLWDMVQMTCYVYINTPYPESFYLFMFMLVMYVQTDP